MLYQVSPQQILQAQITAKIFFKDRRGNPFNLTYGQAEIFASIYDPLIRRVVIRAVTRYGKSETSSMALIMAAITRRERILIVAPSTEQASIIMRAVIDHLFDHPYLTGMLEVDTPIERLKRERSKERITFKNGSEIFILTANVNEVSKQAKSLMGFGATIVMVDESSLIPDAMFSKILRMTGDDPEHGKLIQLGNPFEKNHFYLAFKQDRYYKIVVKKEQAIREGRLSQELIDEARETMPPMDFLIFYDCEFPDANSDSLIPLSWVEAAVNNKHAQPGDKQSGLDVARFGGDKTVYVYRDGGITRRIETCDHMDTMKVVGWSSNHLDKDGKPPMNIDVVGIGAGVYDRYVELEDYEVTPINVGEAPTTDESKKKFHNLRAEFYWELRERFQLRDGKSSVSIPNDADLIRELSELRYAYSSEKKIKIESKDELKKRINRSPDKADALGMAFFTFVEVRPEMVII